MSKRPQPASEGNPYKKKRLCSFRPEFTQMWPFIVKTARSDFARCTMCNTDFSIGHQGKVDCQRHIQTQKHSNLAASSRGNSSISSFLKPASSSLDDDVTRAEILFTNFLVEHNISISASDHAARLFQSMFLGKEHSAADIIKRYGCARTKTSCIIRKMSEIQSADLIRDMIAGPYSIATDASNDRNEKLFPLVVRLERQGRIETHLLSVLESVGKGTGENISRLILEDMASKQIPLSNCMALTTDNANVMIGQKAGLYGHLLRENKAIFATGRVCHRIHLAAEWATKKLPKNINNFFVDFYYYMDKSSNRINSFHEFQESCGTPVTAVCKHCPTRWLSMRATCAWVLEQWEPLRQFFKEECDNNGEISGRCRNVLDNLNSRTMKLYIMYLNYVLPVFNTVNLIFQKESLQVHKQRRVLLRMVKDLQTMFLKLSLASWQLMLTSNRSTTLWKTRT